MNGIPQPYLISVEPETKIWRFMDISKFESLIKTESLFLCRADKFEDTFEGSIPIKEAKHRSDFMTNGLLGDTITALNQIKGIQKLHKKLKKAIVINSWHINDFESDAMWKLYQTGQKGVAIESTVGKILKGIKKPNENISISKVRYIDYENDIWFDKDEYPFRGYNMITPFVHKKIEFRHEQEFRIFEQIEGAILQDDYWVTQENENGKFIKVDLEEIVENIYFHPDIDKDMRSKIIVFCKKFGKSINFKVSRLAGPPIY